MLVAYAVKGAAQDAQPAAMPRMRGSARLAAQEAGFSGA